MKRRIFPNRQSCAEPAPADDPSRAADAIQPGEPSASPAPMPAGPPEAPLAAPPSHYWTWRMLAAGFTPEECAAARSLASEVVLDHALRAADEGHPVEAAWFLAPERIARIERLLGDDPPTRLRPLLEKLPRGTRYEELQLVVKSRRARIAAGAARLTRRAQRGAMRERAVRFGAVRVDHCRASQMSGPRAAGKSARFFAESWLACPWGRATPAMLKTGVTSGVLPAGTSVAGSKNPALWDTIRAAFGRQRPVCPLTRSTPPRNRVDGRARRPQPASPQDPAPTAHQPAKLRVGAAVDGHSAGFVHLQPEGEPAREHQLQLLPRPIGQG